MHGKEVPVESNTIITKFQEGDENAFQQLVESYQQKAFRIAVLIVQDDFLANDIVQETFLKVYLNRDQLKNLSHFSSWFYRILTRTAWELSKKQLPLCKDENIFQTISSPEDMEQDILQKEVHQQIQQALRALPYHQRTAIVLYYYEGMSVKEIAQATGSMQGTVQSRLFLARKKLRPILESILKKEER